MTQPTADSPSKTLAGYGYEHAATRPDARSVISDDVHKHVIAVGVSVHLADFRIDAAYALLLSPEQVVDPDESQAWQLNPINPASAVRVGGGRYRSTSHVLSVGVQQSF